MFTSENEINQYLIVSGDFSFIVGDFYGLSIIFDYKAWFLDYNNRFR